MVFGPFLLVEILTKSRIYSIIIKTKKGGFFDMERPANLPVYDGLCPVCASSMMELNLIQTQESPHRLAYYKCGICGYQRRVDFPCAESVTGK